MSDELLGIILITHACYFFMEGSEPKGGNPVLNIIRVNSLRLGGLHLKYKIYVMKWISLSYLTIQSTIYTKHFRSYHTLTSLNNFLYKIILASYTRRNKNIYNIKNGHNHTVNYDKNRIYWYYLRTCGINWFQSNCIEGQSLVVT